MAMFWSHVLTSERPRDVENRVMMLMNKYQLLAEAGTFLPPYPKFLHTSMGQI